MLEITPITLREANAYVDANHRHHKAVAGCLFCVAVQSDGNLRGVAIVGRPVARGNDDGYTAEVLRCCTDGKRNAPSMLYRAAWRAARAIGYRKVITYTLPEEGGTSLRAAGFKCVGKVTGRSWNCSSRPRVDTTPMQDKLRWEL